MLVAIFFNKNPNHIFSGNLKGRKESKLQADANAQIILVSSVVSREYKEKNVLIHWYIGVLLVSGGLLCGKGLGNPPWEILD